MNSNFINVESVMEIYEGKDLGLMYSMGLCVFKVWAPKAIAMSLVLYETDGNDVKSIEDSGRIVYMQKGHCGVWQTKLYGDYKGKYYMYRAVFADGNVVEAVDPYARAVSANGVRTAIIDLRDTDPIHWSEDVASPLQHHTEAVIYELHVRDFSSHESSGMLHKGKYKAFTEFGLRDSEGNTLGIDHLVELGVTHVHLMPVFDFQTVDELNVDHDYNWGYDPQNYNVPEGSYSTNPADPGLRIREFKEMVQALHSRGISVIMDVVYNHTYCVDSGPFEPLVPDYFYRRDFTGRLSNGSGVGNELATERPMVRKYIKESLSYWAGVPY